jgi:hypothetical protein
VIEKGEKRSEESRECCCSAQVALVKFRYDLKRTSGNASHQVSLVAPLMDRLGMHLFPSNRNETPRNHEVHSFYH